MSCLHALASCACRVPAEAGRRYQSHLPDNCNFNTAYFTDLETRLREAESLWRWLTCQLQAGTLSWKWGWVGWLCAGDTGALNGAPRAVGFCSRSLALFWEVGKLSSSGCDHPDGLSRLAPAGSWASKWALSNSGDCSARPWRAGIFQRCPIGLCLFTLSKLKNYLIGLGI